MMIKKTTNGVSGSTGSRHSKGFVPALRSAIRSTAKMVKGAISLDEEALTKHATPHIASQGDELKSGMKRELGFFINYGRVFCDIYQDRATKALGALETALADKKSSAETLRKAMEEAVQAFNS